MFYQYQPPKSRYENKLGAMTERVRLLLKHPQIKRWVGLQALLEQFVSFAEDYMGLLNQAPEPISNHPFILNTGIERLLQEWNIISRAGEQRLATGATMTDGDTFTPWLTQAEQVLAGYCQRWHPQKTIDASYLELKTPVVYFEKLYRISRSIYAPEIPVISIPLTDYNDENRWQALPHEFGHHLYWNAVSLKETEVIHNHLRQAIITGLAPKVNEEMTATKLARWHNRVQLWGRWLEETFADICGTLFNGPAYALSAQDMVMDQVNEPKDLTKGDCEHPSPYLRPLIALETLRQMTQREINADFAGMLSGKSGLLNKLEKRWQKFCQKAEQLPHFEMGLSMKELAQDIPVMVRIILDEPIWPAAEDECQPLWNLVDAYGKRTFDETLKETLKQLQQRLDQEDYGDRRFKSKRDAGISSLAETSLPQLNSPALKLASELVQTRVDEAIGRGQLKAQDKQAAIWGQLLRLELSESSYFHVHGCMDDGHEHTVGTGFFPWETETFKRHYHTQLGDPRHC